MSYIKFICEQVEMELRHFLAFNELNEYRRKLRDLGMIGVDANSIGFGNVSMRDGVSSRFYITGTATGGISELKPSDYARVVAYDFGRNWVKCEGTTMASSESLTHAAVYESEPSTGAVIHVHNTKLWAALLHKVPTTPKEVEYGTPEMAHAVRALFRNPAEALAERHDEGKPPVLDRHDNDDDVRQKKILVMAGHKGGLVAFGKDLRAAFGHLEAHRLSIVGYQFS